ncbi:MAG: hypothetical protein ACRDMZ_11600 [Solirubrobacteraceae bacterium]
MIARSLTLTLLAACAAFALWIHDRDWQSPASEHSQRATAAIGAHQLATALRRDCPGCSIQLLDRVATGAWRVRLRAPAGTRCLELRPDGFAASAQHGFRGLRPTSCPRSEPAPERARAWPRKR